MTTAAIQTPRARSHSRFELLVSFDLHLETRTGLHVGAGKSPSLVGSELPVMRDAAGRPLLPGSSVRGVLRSGVEAVVQACELDARRPMVPETQVVQNSLEDHWNQMGTVPRLFGRVGQGRNDFAYATRLHVSDFRTLGNVAVELRDGVGIGRETRTAAGATGAKFDLEVVPAGTRFQGSVRLHDPENFEIGLLAQALVMLDGGLLLLGGKSARGLGWIQVEVGPVHRLRAVDLLKARAPADEPDGVPPPAPIESVEAVLGKELEALRSLASREPSAPEPRFDGMDPARPARRSEKEG